MWDEGPESWRLACPGCEDRPGLVPGASGCEDRERACLRCPQCGRVYERCGGVWQCLPAERARAWAPFLAEYGAVRSVEGRAAAPSAALARPRPVRGAPRAWEWRVRDASFQTLAAAVLRGPGRKVLDLGAGSGWLSHRLRGLGHRVAAVDISDDPDDGLGASLVYDRANGAAGPQRFLRVRAEFDRLPFEAGAAEVAVFNASFHYSPDPGMTLAEAARVVGPGGRVVVMDSPLYDEASHGDAMVAERKARFRKLYGFPSDRHGGVEFLTWRQLEGLGREVGLRWHVHAPSHGWRYALRPWRARLLRRRPPSRFVVLEGWLK